MRSGLPSGTVTFLFTDVEGSTRLLHELGAEGYAEALAEHRRLIRDACTADGGVEVDTQGDAFFFAFPTAPGALAAAAVFTESLASGPIAVRVALHTGTPLLTDEGYVGGDVHRAARIAACGHGGQVLVSSSTAQLVELELRDLGEHRLKDLSAPERVYQLGDGDFPALKSLYRTNLPVPATPFLGREQELAEVVALLAADNARLLTLTGPGGTGKTRLALQAAGHASEAYPDGVFWIPLASLRDPALVLATAGQTLGSKNGLAEHIQDKAMLCLFDNFEQVVEAAPELATLLSACPNLDLLVTSRERLRVFGEQTYPVPPLAESDGEALFLTRARAVDPAFAPSDAVRELCLRLDELPLAIELAAARTALFSPEQLLAKLSQRLDLLKGERDADPRQQTLRATIEWSYDLLVEDEQRLFRRLAVFSGGCTYESAEEIADADPETLQSLLDKSLLRKRDSKTGPRYWMLETIREYAGERLEASGEAEELRKRHAEWFLMVAEDAEPHLRGGTPGEVLHRLDPEHDNVRAALDWLAAAGETQAALRLGAAFWRYWNLRGHHQEGVRRLDLLLALDDRLTTARARVVAGAGCLAEDPGRLELALELNEQLGDTWGAAHANLMLGSLAVGARDLERGRELVEDAASAFRLLGDDHYELYAIRMLAWAYYDLGDTARAQALHEDVVRLARAAHNQQALSGSLGSLAEYALYEGRVEDALPMLRESTLVLRAIGDRAFLRLNVLRWARAYGLENEPRRAARLMAAVEAFDEEVGIVEDAWVVELNEGTLAMIRAQLDEGELEHAWGEGRRLPIEDAVELALDTKPDA